jgi:DNA polymerase III subunit alpha
MAYIMLEDTQGSVEVIVFPDLYAQSHLLLKSDRPIVVTGSVERSEDGTVKMKAKKVRPLDEVARDIRRTVKITVYCDRFKKEDLKKLRDVLLGVKGKSPLVLEFVFNGDRQTLDVAGITVDHGRLDILRKYFENCVDYEVFDEVLP